MSEPPAIVVHSLVHAFAAADAASALGVRLTLRSAETAACYAGVGWFAALEAAVRERHPGLDAVFVLDCADEAGTAMGALRRGIRTIRFSGPTKTAAKLVALGADIDTSTAPPLDLNGIGDPASHSRKFLAGRFPAR